MINDDDEEEEKEEIPAIANSAMHWVAKRAKILALAKMKKGETVEVKLQKINNPVNSNAITFICKTDGQGYAKH